jgi:hypothetical protein
VPQFIVGRSVPISTRAAQKEFAADSLGGYLPDVLSIPVIR